MTNDERRPTGLLHSADELRQLIRANPTLPLTVIWITNIGLVRALTSARIA